MKWGITAVILIAALSPGGAASAAAPVILVDGPGPNADADCGKYAGQPVTSTNPLDAISNAGSGSMVVICPG